MGDQAICTVCRGKQTLQKRVKDEARYSTIPCWRCNGTGVWARREDAWPFNQVRRG